MYSKNVSFDADGVTVKVNKLFSTAGDGLWSDVAKQVYVTEIAMCIDTEGDEDGDYYDGDLAVCYDESTWDNKTDGLIYTDKLFIAQVREYLIAQGFNAVAVNDITYSEQGMQDDGRVSCDAYELADSIRDAVIAA